MSVSEFDPRANTPSRRATEGPAPDLARRLAARIDPPHVVDRGEATPPETEPQAARIAAGNATPARERMLRQARQLTEFLRRRRFDLDRREAQTHAALAQAEAQDRTSRLWLEERQGELDQRAAALAQREQELEISRLAQQAAEDNLARDRQAIERASDRMARRERRLAALERVLGRRRRELLEWRLALEELWGEAVERADRETLERRLQAIRSRLADEYRDAQLALARGESRLLRLQQELAGPAPARRGRG